MHPKISVIIPNWNGKKLLEKHLTAVLDAGSDEIIIADDASDDGSVDYIRKNYPQIKLVISPKRSGFSGNVNSGVKAATGDIIVLINTDVEPHRDFLKALIPHFADKNVFAVGCLDLSHESGKIIKRGRGIARWHKGYYIHARGENDKQDTAWVSGGSGAFCKDLWIKLGGLDEIYNPFYWEDIDLSYRARKQGYGLVFEKNSVVEHFHESGMIKGRYTPGYIKTIAYRNQHIFIWKNVTSLKLLLIHKLWLIIRLIQALIRFDIGFIKGFFMAILMIPKIVFYRFRKNKWELSDEEIIN